MRPKNKQKTDSKYVIIITNIANRYLEKYQRNPVNKKEDYKKQTLIEKHTSHKSTLKKIYQQKLGFEFEYL